MPDNISICYDFKTDRFRPKCYHERLNCILVKFKKIKGYQHWIMVNGTNKTRQHKKEAKGSEQEKVALAGLQAESSRDAQGKKMKSVKT